MSRVIVTRLAQADLKDIGRYIAQHNDQAARRWICRLRTTCKETLGMFPGCGTQMDHLLPGMRAFSVRDYVIFFRGRDPVEILRVVNGAMDFENLRFHE